MGNIVIGREVGKETEEGIEEYFRQNKLQSEVGDSLIVVPRPCQVGGHKNPHQPRSETCGSSKPYFTLILHAKVSFTPKNRTSHL
jgi:hypothetical protein